MLTTDFFVINQSSKRITSANHQTKSKQLIFTYIFEKKSKLRCKNLTQWNIAIIRNLSLSVEPNKTHV